VSAFSGGNCLAGESPAPGFAAGTFVAVGDAAVGRGDSKGADFKGADFKGVDFNRFDGALCDALGGVFPGCLLAVLADFLTVVVRRVFAADVLVDAAVRARVAFAAGALSEALGDFLRVFLDIRLPFVAFGGSIIGLLRVGSQQARIAPSAGQI
jgi:hypothetical protein